MRTFHALVALLAIVLAITPLGSVEAKPKAAGSSPYPEIRLNDGLFTTHDGGVTCRVSQGWINCANGGRPQITCLNDRCTPHYTGSWPPEDLAITSRETQAPKRVLPAYTVNLLLPRIGCMASAHVIECRTIDYTGGFQMDRLFGPCTNWDDAPSGWPWDGRKHTAKEIVPGV